MEFSVDRESKTIHVRREFAAPLARVWAAWTQAEALDKWWAPRNWHARTKSMDFREGGFWLYGMFGPDGEEHWGRVDFLAITPSREFSTRDTFCDENGNIDPSIPTTHSTFGFSETQRGTVVTVATAFNALADLDMFLESGFEGGYSDAFEKLAALLAQEGVAH